MIQGSLLIGHLLIGQAVFLVIGKDGRVIPVVQYKETITESILTILTKNAKKIVQKSRRKKTLSHDPNSKICVPQHQPISSMVRMKIFAAYSIWQLMHLYQFYAVATQLLPALYASSSIKRGKSLGLEHGILSQNTFPGLQTLRLFRSESKLCACDCCPVLCGWCMKDKSLRRRKGETRRL